MPLKRLTGNISVVQAAEIRVKNIFQNGLPVYLSFSGGKDSLALAQIVVNLIRRGEVNPSQLTVHFIDEEAIFPCIEKTVQEWRKKFLLLGAKFEWYCLEVRHFNCFNELDNDESFICWDNTKKDVWVRKQPPFAIKEHRLLKPRQHTYQTFLQLRCKDGITLIGVRTAESVQRLNSIASMKGSINTKQQAFPIYDWTDKDVWLYLKEQNVKIPNVYLYMYQVGIRKNKLRVSQFFSIDTARSLVKMNEFYPNLMDRIIKREPNAYLAALYWDSELFGRSTKQRRENEGTEIKVDYRAKLLNLFQNIPVYFTTPHKQVTAKKYKNFFLRVSNIVDQKDCKSIYEALIGGDPKLRNYRALYVNIYGKYSEAAKKGLI